MKDLQPIPTQIIGNVPVLALSPSGVRHRFLRLLESGTRLRVDGRARRQPSTLLQSGYTPRYEIQLFGTRYFLCNRRHTEDGLKLLPAYVMTPNSGRIHARVFYKDSSLVWRAASHIVDTPAEQWIGKGAVKSVWVDGEEHFYSAEETTNLPFEMQSALDEVSRRGPRSRTDHRLLGLVLRNAPQNRVWPYNDFLAPRERAMALPANQVNYNKAIAWFDDPSDPTALHFEPGYQPDFSALIDRSESRSTMYSGAITKYRIISVNRLIQYLFVAGSRHVWIVHPQPFTTEVSSYGTRTVDVIADEELFIPGYEFADIDGSGEIDDQIPKGFAGPPCPFDPDRADASPWNENLPVIREFRSKLGHPYPA